MQLLFGKFENAMVPAVEVGVFFCEFLEAFPFLCRSKKSGMRGENL